MSKSVRKKILFYCQSLVGLGHLTSSLQVIKELLNFADVDLIYGGHTIQTIPDYEGFRAVRLPTILINSETEALYVPGSHASIESTLTDRLQEIENFVSAPYDALIVEFFPFGRRRLKKEILKLFQIVKAANSSIPIFSFVREILVPASDEAEQRMVKLVNDYIHTVFVRGDPSIVKFDETFNLTQAIAGRLYYAGYVGPSSPDKWPVRENKIIVSQGGGEIGKVLLRAAIQTAPLLPNYKFMIVASARASTSELNELKSLICSSNVEVVSFLTDFQAQLVTSALSISLGGDNTMMDVISTHTPAMAFPFGGNSEQLLRIAKLSEKGFVCKMTESDLEPEQFCRKICENINKPYPKEKINIKGASNISMAINEVLSKGLPPGSLHQVPMLKYAS